MVTDYPLGKAASRESGGLRNLTWDSKRPDFSYNCVEVVTGYLPS